MTLSINPKLGDKRIHERKVNTAYKLVCGHGVSGKSHQKSFTTCEVECNKHVFITTQYHDLCFIFAQRFAVKRSYFINIYNFFPNVPVCCHENILYFNLKSYSL